jgi:hypothetical protein
MKLKSLLMLTAVSYIQLHAQPAYNYAEIQREQLGRGLVCVNDGDSTVISWRYRSDDGDQT